MRLGLSVRMLDMGSQSPCYSGSPSYILILINRFLLLSRKKQNITKDKLPRAEAMHY
jgi:hypothetical protein